MNKVVLVVLIVGILGLIIGFSAATGMKIYSVMSLEKNTKFPPWPSKCPDYWSSIGDNRCQNLHKIGDCKSSDTDNIMDFSEPIFGGNKGMYYKCNWAKKCNAPWEGIDSLC